MFDQRELLKQFGRNNNGISCSTAAFILQSLDAATGLIGIDTMKRIECETEKPL